ncbi:ubiquinone biosynthesis protein UbiH, partial [Pseudomonas putida]|nr:ubiquinone biosynthesis protein UbiH [Pseudomonas putida]
MAQADVIILGGGLVGSTLGVSLSVHGLRSIILDPADPAVTLAPGFDGRASAIASATHRMFEAIGIAEGLGDEGCPIAAIR